MNQVTSATRNIIIAAVIIIAVIAIGYGASRNKNEMPKVSSEKQANMDAVIGKWIEENPQAILDSLNNYMMQMQKESAKDSVEKASKNISAKSNELNKDPDSPVANPKGNVTVVHFFDYNCSYCRKEALVVAELIKQDKNVKVIFKELPILGSSSEYTSKVALAASMIDGSKYVALHEAMMKGNIGTESTVLAIAQNVGYDVGEIRKVMENDASKIESILQKNHQLASDIGINGTPAFVINGKLVPGAVPMETLKKEIEEARRKK